MPVIRLKVHYQGRKIYEWKNTQMERTFCWGWYDFLIGCPISQVAVILSSLVSIGLVKLYILSLFIRHVITHGHLIIDSCDSVGCNLFPLSHHPIKVVAITPFRCGNITFLICKNQVIEWARDFEVCVSLAILSRLVATGLVEVDV